MSTPSRPTLTERRAEELRMTIALTARDIFLADGSTSATVDRICEAVGIAPRTFRHFPVKEDVVMPLFRQFGGLSVEVLQHAPRASDTVDTLVQAFTTEVAKRGELEIDRKFMALVITDPQYRLRWLDWGQDLADPISDFLASRFELGTDPLSARCSPAGHPDLPPGLRSLGRARRLRQPAISTTCRHSDGRPGIAASASHDLTATGTWCDHFPAAPGHLSTDSAV